MEIVKFEDVKETIISNMRRSMLIPIIGAGFTKGCKSYKGSVPSGEEYKEHMLINILESIDVSPEEEKRLREESFSSISEIYFNPEIVPTDKQRNYLRDNFTRVQIEDYKKRLLSLPWPYIYTLNIDDGIESGSVFHHVVHSNREINEKIFDEEKYVIKLHGDVHDMITYHDDNGAVLTQKQYVNSIRLRYPLQTKLEHDSDYLNLIYIGCSLDDEIDLLAYTGTKNEKVGITARYYCSTRTPSKLEALKFSNFGITHYIVFDSYDVMYNELHEAGQESLQIRVDDLEKYKRFSVKKLLDYFDENKPYLLFGKSLINKDRSICLPYFFISRGATGRIVSDLVKYPVQIVVGSGCSGKSYVLTDIACRVRDRDVFFFETKDRLTDTAFNDLLNRKGIIVLADNNSLSLSQIERLFDSIPTLESNHTHFIITANRHDHDISGILRLKECLGVLCINSVSQYAISDRLTQKELADINPALTAIGAGLFASNRTIVDNIISIGERLEEDNKYRRITPKLRTSKEIAALIALSTEKKVYSQQAVALNLQEEMALQVKTARPLIDSEATWSFEKTSGDNSPTKYVINAEYWLNNILSSLAVDDGNKTLIVDAYEYIVRKLIEQYGPPDILFDNKKSRYREYIKFDNINKLFCPDQKKGKDGLSLIRLIYERLNKLLSVDPHYMHQRAKCYIKSSYYERAKEKKQAYLDKAFRDVNVAEQVFSHRYDDCRNEKLLVSIAHVIYTKALIYCHKCRIVEYKDVEMNSTAIRALYEAMKSPYNSFEFAKNDVYNYGNAIKHLVNSAISDRTMVSDECIPLLEELLEITITSNNRT